MLKDYISEKYECFHDAIDVLAEPHYTYDGEEGLIYDEGSFDSFNWNTGVSKICILIDKIALKTSFRGYVYDYDEEKRDWYAEPSFEDWDKDYCEMEYQLFLLAKKAGLQEYFAETVYIRENVYAQEGYDNNFEDYYYSMTDILEDEEKFPLNKTKEELFKSNLDTLGLYNLRVKLGIQPMRYLVMQHSLTSLLKFQSFLEKYDINDLHWGNFGWFGDKIKFFDFCGYGSNTQEKLKNN